MCQPFIQTIPNTTIISHSLFIYYCIIIHLGGRVQTPISNGIVWLCLVTFEKQGFCVDKVLDDLEREGVIKVTERVPLSFYDRGMTLAVYVM